MAELLIQAMPGGLDIGDGYVIRLAAYDPTTGAAVTGVQVSNAAIQARKVQGPDSFDVPLPALVPSDQLV